MGGCWDTENESLNNWGGESQPIGARHRIQSHGFAVRVWSNLCICSPGVVELVRSNLAPDFPLFHGVYTQYTAAEPRPRRLNDWCCLCRNGQQYQQYQCSNGQSTESMQHIIFCILPPLHSLFTQTQARIAPGINDGPKHEYADTKDDM